MNKKFVFLIIFLIIGSVSAQNNSSIDINGVNFEIPDEYLGGDKITDGYRFENIFSIYCIDEDIPRYVGLWANEKDYAKNLTINNHPVRYYYQYNSYVNDNDSHAYFASGDSIYEISWIGNEINPRIDKIISETPKSNIDYDTFNNILDESIDIYKEQRVTKLNQDAKYNYLETKILENNIENFDDERTKELMYMLNNKYS